MPQATSRALHMDFFGLGVWINLKGVLQMLSLIGLTLKMGNGSMGGKVCMAGRFAWR